MKITKKHKYYLGFFVACLVLSFFLTVGCHSDDYYDDYYDDPLRGGGGSIICTEDVSWLQVFTRDIGFYIFGFLAHKVLKEAQQD